MVAKTIQDKINALVRQVLNKGPMLEKALPLLGTHVAVAQYPSWNEKGVEYYYARHILDDDAIADPLDGDAETLFGDLITGIVVGSAPGFCTIEFKARHSDINSEYEKYFRTMNGIGMRPQNQPFPHWFAAQNADLAAMKGSRHHFLVYGEQPRGKAFGLRYGRYAATRYKRLGALSDLVFCDGLTMTEYLGELAKARYRGPLPGGGGQEIFAEARSQLAASFKNTLLCSEEGGCISSGDLLHLFAQWSDKNGSVNVDGMCMAVLNQFLRKQGRTPDMKEQEKIKKLLFRAHAAAKLLAELESASNENENENEMAVGASKSPAKASTPHKGSNGTQLALDPGST